MIAPAVAPSYEGQACFVTFGSVMGNTVSASRPYTSSMKAGIDADLATMRDNYGPRYQKLFWASTSYRGYQSAPLVTPEDQSNGSLPYNENVLHPFLAANFFETYDSSLKRSRIDEYLKIMLHRDLMDDGVHGAFAEAREVWIDTALRYVYTGSWGTSQIEQRMGDAEAKAVDSSPASVAQKAYDEAGYALAALVASSAKTALAARLDAVEPMLLLKIADEAVTYAETVATADAKDDAQAAIDAAEAAGADVTALQARLDAVTGPPGTQNAYIWHGIHGSVPAGWNAGGEGVSGVGYTPLPNIVDENSNNTGWSMWVAGGVWGSQSAQAQQTSGSDWVPDVVTTSCIYSGGSTVPSWEIRGLNDDKLYDIGIYAIRFSGTGKNVVFTVNGVAQPQFDAGNTTSATMQVNDVSPSGGIIRFSVNRGSPTNGFVYLTATRIVEKSA